MQGALDFGRLICVILGNVAGHRDHADAVLAPHGRKAGATVHADDIGQGDVIAFRRAHHGTLEEIGRQFSVRQFDLDRGCSDPVRIGRRLKPVQTMT